MEALDEIDEITANNIILLMKHLSSLININEPTAFVIAQRTIKKTNEMKVRERNKIRIRNAALYNMSTMSSTNFRRMFRLSRDAFEILLERISVIDLERDETRAVRSSGSPITLRTKLACTLRFLAGGSYLDICFAFGVAIGVPDFVSVDDVVRVNSEDIVYVGR
jgi:hypothetical protein